MPQVAAHLGHPTMLAACEGGVAWACGIERIDRTDRDGILGLGIEYAADWSGTGGNGAPDVAADPAGVARAVLPQLPGDVQRVAITRDYIDTTGWDDGVYVTHTYTGKADRDGQ